jgi:hypothetical protein
MNRLIFVIAILASLSGNAQKVSFTTILNKENATKEGIYLNGYVVNISYDSILKLDKKKIRVTGKYKIIEGLKKKPNTTIAVAGRAEDWKYIDKPKIEIVKE